MVKYSITCMGEKVGRGVHRANRTAARESLGRLFPERYGFPGTGEKAPEDGDGYRGTGGDALGLPDFFQGAEKLFS